MSYSDRSSGSGAAGVAGTFVTILLVVLGVGLKIAARAARNSNRNSYSYDYSSPPNMPLSRDDARQPYISPPSVPVEDRGAEFDRQWREQGEAAARRQLEWQQQQEANRQQQAQQAEADRQRRANEQAQAEQQRAAEAARRQAEMEQRDRDWAAQQAAQNAARNAPPAQPAQVAPQPAQPAAPANNPDVPPGFPVTNVDQVKPKATVFARAQDGWFPAVITRRVGAEVTVRYTTNGVVDRVALNRIRLQTDPANDVAANAGTPAALRPVAARDPANKPVPEDDALIVAKPRTEEPAEQPAFTAPTASPAVSGPLPMLRTWTNDSGEFKVDAELVSFEFDLVQLKKTDGKVISIRIEKLSADDQAFIRAKFP